MPTTPGSLTGMFSLSVCFTPASSPATGLSGLTDADLFIHKTGSARTKGIADLKDRRVSA